VSRPRLLLVDDSHTQALKLQMLLEGEGYEVEWAASAEEAMEALNRAVPDLMVVDYLLPGMRGDQLCRRVRMNVKTRSLPILMLTMREGQETELRGLESGADDYVSKAADKDILLLRIRNLLRQSRPQASVLESLEAHLRRSRLLAIDDSETYLEFLAAELESEGYLLETTTRPTQALERLAAEPFDCVLVDLVMPEMDGIEVCRRIHQLRPALSRPLTVLVLTARESKEDLTRALDSGADDFVGKSSDIAVLKGRIRALLRRKLYQEENQRILEELKNKELETLRARAETEKAEARAALAEELARANRELEETNRRLKETQAQLVQSEKMASLGQLVAGIAHEINNPLAFVITNLFNAETRLDRLAPQVEAGLDAESLPTWHKVRAMLADMRSGLERIRDLVVKLRTFSRLDEGEFKTVDIHESIESVLLFLRHRIQDRIQVVRAYGPVSQLACFPGQLNQVLMNILSNAVEAIEDQGAITVTTGIEEDWFCIRVRDTGVGLPPGSEARIFEPFFTTKPVGQGTGLGLAISYTIVQAHQGSLTARRLPEGGSEFCVRLPLDLDRRLQASSGRTIERQSEGEAQ
jgi:two-component system NtrC family sensor kinase